MKRIYSIAIFATFFFSANAQVENKFSSGRSTYSFNQSVQIADFPDSDNRAIGDTVMYMKLPKTFLKSVDQATFQVVTEDLDNRTAYNAPLLNNKSFSIFYSDDTMHSWPSGKPTMWNLYHPWENPSTDSSFFWGATSWFSPAGKADNWLEFGTVTIPATGATLKWYDRTNLFRDGYQVFVTDNFSVPGTFTFDDFTENAIFTVADAGDPSPTLAIDTTWELKSVDLPERYNGQKVAIAFHHTATDMDFLRLDEIHLVEKALGVNENNYVNGGKLYQNSPNPARINTVINYSLQKGGTVNLNIMDITGKVIEIKNKGEEASGSHNITINTENFAAGVYYYSLILDNNTVATQKMVVIK